MCNWRMISLLRRLLESPLFVTLSPPRAAGRLTPVTCYSTRADSNWSVGDSQNARAPLPHLNPTMGKVKNVSHVTEEHFIQISCRTLAIILAIFETHNVAQSIWQLVTGWTSCAVQFPEE
jgi:hypothetical protein